MIKIPRWLGVFCLYYERLSGNINCEKGNVGRVWELCSDDRVYWGKRGWFGGCS